MAIPNGVIFIWTGTDASIPSGWQRVTDLNDRFVKGHLNGSTNPNLTGGASTHTHTSPSHTHTISAHTHTVTVGAGTGGGIQTSESGDGNAWQGHTHAQTTSGGVTGASVTSTAVTYDAVDNAPPFYAVTFITPTSVAGGLPNLAIGLSDDTGFVNNTGKYNGYYFTDGTNSTPDLRNRYLVGASTGVNAGYTGGSTTNIHAINHSHSQSHSHDTATVPATTSESFKYDLNTPYQTINTNHTHTVSFNANGDSVSTFINITCDETVEPAFKKLIAVQNRSSTPYTPVGLIGLWTGTLTSVPSNFELVTSMYDKYLKIANNTTEIGNTGGSNTHTHGAKSHTHTLSHTHTGSISGHVATLDDDGTGRTGATTATTHAITINSSTLTLEASNTTADSSSNEPLFRTVAFIKYKGETGGGFLFNLLR